MVCNLLMFVCGVMLLIWWVKSRAEQAALAIILAGAMVGSCVLQARRRNEDQATGQGV